MTRYFLSDEVVTHGDLESVLREILADFGVDVNGHVGRLDHIEEQSDDDHAEIAELKDEIERLNREIDGLVEAITELEVQRERAS